MEFALATVIFPGVKPFFPEFARSLRNQTDKNFHLLIVNDGCILSDFDLTGFNYTIINPGGSVSKNRERLISEADKKKFEWIVFADADDWFEDNRIETIRGLSLEYDLIANDLVPFSDDHFSNPKFVGILGRFRQIEFSFILDKNLFGLSNVACRTRFLQHIVIPDDIIAVDWYLFSRAILGGARNCFTAATKTYYRQWTDNTIGMDKNSDAEIRTALKVKYFHYKYMSDTHPFFRENFPWISNLYHNMDGDIFDVYLKKLRETGLKTNFWWENIKN